MTDDLRLTRFEVLRIPAWDAAMLVWELSADEFSELLDLRAEE